MHIDDALLTKLEKLSYLEIAEDKREEIISQLSEIVSFVDNLSELDTTNMDPTFAMTDKGTQLREDIPNSSKNISQSILKNAPHSEDNFFIVPKIIE
ncbi:Asp-tRNA(Asn)/Glu-tRNA(Gln) amidotransferase subunit GatC [Sulfurimonas sp. MAG313]|nr:Asp-tRNA(Asn)/Glu-tRNA(Gln) amidotransferase subunit GatC [Sulfurimonas sp. MAG313]MDF1881360.1 Asp-tRNA(Asn)/Glu-tRNA(Gln) amidotransferase subunit GatC [Sulfurimonas sp. MAG313]